VGLPKPAGDPRKAVTSRRPRNNRERLHNRQNPPAIPDDSQPLPDDVQRDQCSRVQSRKKLGRAAAARKRILYAGAVSPYKGLHVLLDAFCLMVKEYPKVRLDVVGVQASYPLAENFELRQRELIESVYPFYAMTGFPS
jgi:glycosyltransferase involved in cell wall biosynthesis